MQGADPNCDAGGGGNGDEPASLHQLFPILARWAPGSGRPLRSLQGETAGERGVRGTRSEDAESLGGLR